MLYVLYFASFRYLNITFEIKIIPFATIIECFDNLIKYNNLDFFKNIFGNVILFIPYGFLGILYPKLKRLSYLMLAFFIIINIIEFSQYYFHRGFADIDDVILNSLGVFIGFLIYRKFFMK